MFYTQQEKTAKFVSLIEIGEEKNYDIQVRYFSENLVVMTLNYGQKDYEIRVENMGQFNGENVFVEEIAK